MIRTELITLGFRKRRPLGITYSYRFQHTQSEQQPKDFWNNVYRAANSSTAKILYAVTGGAWVAMYIYRLYSDNRFTDIVTRDMRTLPRRSVEGESKFQFIIMGGGPGGCTTAYCLSKWLEEMNLPGKVLLIDAGPDLTQSDLRLESWEREWGAKSTVFEQHIVDPITGEQTLHPVFPSEHRGLGGGSAHNTAIPMCLDPEERHRYTLQTGCTRELFDACHQAAILLEPITPASASNPWWESFIETVTNGVDLRRVPQNFLNIAGDENTIGYFAVAGWPRNDRKKKRNLLDYKALRFTSALLVQKTPKHQIPSRLTVLSNTAVQRVAFRGINMQGLPIAGGVVVKEQNGCTEQESLLELDERGELICALGALSGPSVMQWSGIGDPKVLKKANIPCILPNRHVGAHGHDHTETSVVYEVGGKLHSHADSSLSVMGWDVGVFRRLPKSNAVIQCHASFGGFPYTQSEDDKVLVTTPNLTEPESEFCIQVRTADPKDCFDILHEPFTKKDREVLVESVRDIIHLWEPAQRAGLIGKRISPCPDKSPEEIQFEDLHIETPFHWHNTMSRGKAIAASDGKLLNEYGQRVSNIRVVGASAIRARRNLHIPIMGNAVYVSLASFEEYARRIGQHSVVREPNLIKIARREVAKKSQDQNFTWKKPGEEIDSMHEVALELQSIFEAQKA